MKVERSESSTSEIYTDFETNLAGHSPDFSTFTIFHKFENNLFKECSIFEQNIKILYTVKNVWKFNMSTAYALSIVSSIGTINQISFIAV